MCKCKIFIQYDTILKQLLISLFDCKTIRDKAENIQRPAFTIRLSVLHLCSRGVCLNIKEGEKILKLNP